MGREHAIEMMMAGAGAVQVGAAMQTYAPVKIAEGMQKFCEEDNGINNISEIVGTVKPYGNNIVKYPSFTGRIFLWHFSYEFLKFIEKQLTKVL